MCWFREAVSRTLHCPSEHAETWGQECGGDTRGVDWAFSLSFPLPFLPSHFLFFSFSFFKTHSCSSPFSLDKFAHPSLALAPRDQNGRPIHPPAGDQEHGMRVWNLGKQKAEEWEQPPGPTSSAWNGPRSKTGVCVRHPRRDQYLGMLSPGPALLTVSLLYPVHPSLRGT